MNKMTVTIDETGRVVIDSPELARQLEEARVGVSAGRTEMEKAKPKPDGGANNCNCQPVNIACKPPPQ